MLNQRSDTGDETSDLQDDVGFDCSRFAVQLVGVFRSSPLVDVDANEGPALTIGV